MHVCVYVGGGGETQNLVWTVFLVLCFALGCVHHSGEVAHRGVHDHCCHLHLQAGADAAGIHTGVPRHPRVPEGKKLYPDGQVSLSLCVVTVMAVAVAK